MSRVLHSTGGKALVVLVFVGLFLTVGVPRFLAGDTGPSGSNGDANFDKICRRHGGTPSTERSSGTTTPQRRCTVRYGGRVYLMDAITPNGFDEDTAKFQRQGCEEATREAHGRRRERFIYHPDTGVCERRP
jgi:hypothetical protein